jgi:flavin reductase (DIM6/NTAB) family NADH-FMN oxidoreductase RutF
MRHTATPIDPRAYRTTIGLLATGVAVISTPVDETVHGMTTNAVLSLSLEPTLLLVAVGKQARMAAFLQRATTFTVNILRAEHEALSTFFAGGWRQPTPPPFRFVPWEAHPELGVVRLEGALAALGCTMHDIMEGGDHWIVLGRVVALHRGVEPHLPLLFYGGRYRQLDATTHPAPVRRDLRLVDEPIVAYYE